MPYGRPTHMGPQRTSTGLFQITSHPSKGLAIRAPQGGLTGKYFGVNTPENHARAEFYLNLYNTGGYQAVQDYDAAIARRRQIEILTGVAPSDEEMERVDNIRRATDEVRRNISDARDLLFKGDNSSAIPYLQTASAVIERLLEWAAEPDTFVEKLRQYRASLGEGGSDDGTQDTTGGLRTADPAVPDPASP